MSARDVSRLVFLWAIAIGVLVFYLTLPTSPPVCDITDAAGCMVPTLGYAARPIYEVLLLIYGAVLVLATGAGIVRALRH